MNGAEPVQWAQFPLFPELTGLLETGKISNWNEWTGPGAKSNPKLPQKPSALNVVSLRKPVIRR